MCGIAGIISRQPIAPNVISSMLDLMAHRGPDGVGEWKNSLPGDGQISLGHRRLAIIDLTEAASQPMWDKDRTCVLVFNGEIYNYLELRSELERNGARFRTNSDSEVLLEAYKAWGGKCLDRLNGMFAFALYDVRAKRLFAARDRYGEKPFLYVSKPTFFAFASEYKALLSLPQVSTAHDEHALLRAAYNPGAGLDSTRETVFRDIRQLLPGEALELDASELEARIWRYFVLEPISHPTGTTEADISVQFRELLADAVRIRMRSDVSVGSCLSGGLDSSSIVCLARPLAGADNAYHTFTGAFPGTYADESAFADQVSVSARTTAHIVEPSAQRFVNEAASFAWFNELPVGSASQFAQWCVFALAKQVGVTVLLDGQGADELLGGYEQYFAHYVRSLRQTRQFERLARELPQIRARYPLALASPAQSIRDRVPFRLRHLLANHLNLGSSLLFGLRPDVAERVQGEAALRDLPGRNALASTLEQESFGRFLTVLLRYGDRNSMAHSREVRLPFCDHRLAEFVLGLPPEVLMGEAQTKRLLRESMRGVLPEPIRTRWNKQGFRPPQDLWFSEPQFMALVRDTLASRSFRDSLFWIPGAWDRMLARIQGGALHLSWTIWQPFMIELWRQHFLERVNAQRNRLGTLT